jgi:hypothetical protein
VTVERVEGRDDVVKVTPLVASGGCGCEAALEIPKGDIEGVTPTGDRHFCCGKTLSVVNIQFKNPVWENVFGQLTSATSPTPAIGAMGMPVGVVGSASNCLQVLNCPWPVFSPRFWP